MVVGQSLLGRCVHTKHGARERRTSERRKLSLFSCASFSLADSVSVPIYSCARRTLSRQLSAVEAWVVIHPPIEQVECESVVPEGDFLTQTPLLIRGPIKYLKRRGFAFAYAMSSFNDKPGLRPGINLSNAHTYNCTLCEERWRSVESTPSHQCRLGLSSSVDTGMSLLLNLFSAPSGFFLSTPFLPSPQTPACPKFQFGLDHVLQ